MIGKIFMIALFISLCVLSDILMMKALLSIETTLIAASTIFVVIYVNTGNRFMKKKSQAFA